MKAKAKTKDSTPSRLIMSGAPGRVPRSVQFVSQSSLDQQRRHAEEAQARVHLMQQAVEERKRKRETREETEDTTWLSPSVGKRLESSSAPSSDSGAAEEAPDVPSSIFEGKVWRVKSSGKEGKQQGHHHQQHRRHHHHHHHHRHHYQKNDEQIGEAEMEAEMEGEDEGEDEKTDPTLLGPAVPSESVPVREDWMLSTPARAQLGPAAAQREKEEQEAQQIAEEKEERLNRIGVDRPSSNRGRDRDRERGVSDGGASWRARALTRARELAESEGRELTDVMSERWGQEIAVPTKEKDRDRDRDRDRNRRRTFSGSDRSYMRSVGMSSQMAVPTSQSSGAWQPRSRRSSVSSRDGKEPEKANSTPAPEPPTLPERSTDTPMNVNKLAAQALKAQLMGNTAEHERLTKLVEEATHVHPQPIKEDVVVLSPLDALGRMRARTREPSKTQRGSRGKRMGKHDSGGKRTRYYEDDDVDLATVVHREKVEGIQDYDANFANSIVRDSRFKGMNWEEEEYGTGDIRMDKWENRSKTKGGTRTGDLERKKAIQEHKKLENLLSKCSYCFKNPSFSKYLLVSIGMKMYLSLPEQTRLTPGHCLLVPMEHTTSFLTADEEVWQEMELFRQALTEMFSKEGRVPLFLETAMMFRKQQHSFLEVIPLPKDLHHQAPMYFRKALTECEEEWAQNVKLVDTRGRGLRRSIPKGFPYFNVEFGSRGGFAHVIEEEHKFPALFGREIVGGMLKLDPSAYMRPHKVPFEEMKQQILDFVTQWQPFDWTQELDG